jgi:hypothetical protein
MLMYRALNRTQERIVFQLALVLSAVFGAILPGFSTAENLLTRVGGAFHLCRIGT